MCAKVPVSARQEPCLPPAPHVGVVGGGPAGLRAAEVLASAGCRVALFEQKASVGRKFLVAGKGGLNLTHSEPLESFIRRYETEMPRWETLLGEFTPVDLRAWAQSLGMETYVGTSGRVFPRGQQAAALLRRWVARLRTLGVEFHLHQRLAGFARRGDGVCLSLRDPRAGEAREVELAAAVVALGGASWPQTGSDGEWLSAFAAEGVCVAPWQAANCGFEVAWDPRLLAAAEGRPLKNITLTAGAKTVAGEALITRYGLEGGAIYPLGPRLRGMTPPRLEIDLKPVWTAGQLLAKLPAGRLSFQEIMRRWRLDDAVRALLEFQGPGPAADGPALAAHLKRFPLLLKGPRPIAEAISSAGGIAWPELNDDLMLARCRGLFVAGEMIDWEAPTGGYLLQGCFATGTRAARGVLAFLRQNQRS